MPRPATHDVTLSVAEIGAIIVGLHEYLYLVEEGRPEDLLDEAACPADRFGLTASGAASLLDRLAGLLGEPRSPRS
jgi:hypothetical protein